MLDGLFKKKAPKDTGPEPGAPAAGAAPAKPGAEADKGHAGDGSYKRDGRKARRFFEHAQAVTDYDYAIECFVNGLRLDPDNQAMHDALREVALKRKLSGGKPAGMAEKFKSGGKGPIDKMMHAEMLWAKISRRHRLNASAATASPLPLPDRRPPPPQRRPAPTMPTMPAAFHPAPIRSARRTG